MEFPIEVRYLMGPIPFALVDARGAPIGYAESQSGYPQFTTVYADEAKTTPIYKLTSDNINSFSVEHRFAAPDGKLLGSVKRFGRRSVWRAYYEVKVGDGLAFKVREVNPFVKIANFFVSTVPLMQLVTGKVLNPTYRLERLDGTAVMTMKRTGPAMDTSWTWGRVFSISKAGAVSEQEQEVALLAMMIVVGCENTRG